MKKFNFKEFVLTAITIAVFVLCAIYGPIEADLTGVPFP